MYKIIEISKESEIYKLVNIAKNEKAFFRFLFVSPWDKNSNSLLEKIYSNNSSPREAKGILYIVNIWEFPKSTRVFNITTLPHLVDVRGYDIKKEDYLPHLYHCLEID